MGEFELIRQIFLPVAEATATPAVRLGIGDDCAIQSLPAGTELVFSVDTLVEGVHFPRQYEPEHLAWRALAVAASDLAAMGADPVCFTLALTLPSSDQAWLEAFGHGLQAAARAFDLALAGGDTTRGPLTVTIQVHGTVPDGAAITRGGARPADLVCVSGALGDAGAALGWLDTEPLPPRASELLARYHRPWPRLGLGKNLRGLATAAIDISDGLLADLGHILTASGVGATLDVSRVPLSPALRTLHADRAESLALQAGDDYELCFTLPPEHWERVCQLDPGLTVIGRITRESGLILKRDDGEERVHATGYDHFGAAQ
ncbi:MAG: thiamine-phosphate kinase [Marinobacter sp.]|uniref:thiamine-phosphate kinase n=1 Tax=Marinobacter sp. TaxID=50741 RepID=UPI00299D55D8|nr:thiamine-phosphate kinase [Marinobacter sp.]MDX1634710.1 thiamine-phosphate kinase [Marinobacter sp.]